MITDCETCDRKQVPCSSCEESQRSICFLCQGDVADPYCELDAAPIEITPAGIAALVQYETAVSTTHPAILKAQELDDDRSRDLEPNQQALVSEVNRIGDRKVEAYKAAQQIWGDLPKQYRACLIIADEKYQNELTRALTAYEASLEYSDEPEAFAEAAE